LSDLYDVDVLEWPEHQARLLRQGVVGEVGNEAPDWANIIKHVKSVGRSELHTVESLWTLAFLHDLKAEAWPLFLIGLPESMDGQPLLPVSV